MAALGLAITVAVGALLLTSGSAKLLTGRFVADLGAYRILPASAVVPVGRVLPWVEICLGVGLLGSPWPVPFLAAAALLLAVFTAGIVVNLVRDRRIACGCRGTNTPISWRLAVGNTGGVLTALIAAWSTAASPVRTLAGAEASVTVGDGIAVVLTVAFSALVLRLAAVGRELATGLARVAALAPSGPVA